MTRIQSALGSPKLGRIVQVLRQSHLRVPSSAEVKREMDATKAWDPAIDRWLNEGGADVKAR